MRCMKMYFIVNQPLQLIKCRGPGVAVMTQPPGFTTLLILLLYTARKYVLWRPYWYGKRQTVAGSDTKSDLRIAFRAAFIATFETSRPNVVISGNDRQMRVCNTLHHSQYPAPPWLFIKPFPQLGDNCITQRLIIPASKNARRACIISALSPGSQTVYAERAAD